MLRLIFGVILLAMAIAVGAIVLLGSLVLLMASRDRRGRGATPS